MNNWDDMNETEKMGWFDELFLLSALAHSALRTLRDSLDATQGGETALAGALDRAADALIEFNKMLDERRSWSREAAKARAKAGRKQGA